MNKYINKYSCLACGKFVTKNKSGAWHKHNILGTKEECTVSNKYILVKKENN